jgi:hypothetical protein
MTTISAKRPQLADGSGINLRSVTKFVREAHTALIAEGEEDAAHYFEMVLEHIERDVMSGKPFAFSTKIFGL